MSYQGISDFRSDTVTRPTPEMRRVMANAPVGDDVHRDDPTVIELEELSAEITGKPAALFVPSGTMGNTIALILGCGEGKEIIMEEKCHIFNFEAGNVSRLAHSLPRILSSERGIIPLNKIEASIHTAMREHCPPTAAIALENTHNLWGGRVLSLEYMAGVCKIARQHQLHLHLDGARVFNAAVCLDTKVSRIAAHVDSMMFCLSKGLGAPIGSMLVGEKEFIEKARTVRKYLGGSMRQAGIVAAAGILALNTMVDRLADDHLRARNLAHAIADVPGIDCNPDHAETNFVMIKLEKPGTEMFLNKLRQRNILALPFSDREIRFCTHKDIDDNDIELAAHAVRETAAEMQR